METLEKAKQAVQEVAHRYQMADVYLNAQSVAGLELFDGQELCMEFIADRGKLFIHTPLMALTPDAAVRQALLQAALRLNCLESGAAGAVLALDTQGTTLLLQTGLDADTLDAERLAQALNRLLGQRDEQARRLFNIGNVWAYRAEVPAAA